MSAEDKLEKKNRFDGSLNFGAKDFYEMTGRTSQVDMAEEEEIFKRYGNLSTGLIKDTYVKYRNCVCGADDSRLVFVKHGFRFVVCNRCGFLYVNPILKENILANFYENEQGWFEVLQNSIQTQMDSLKFTYGLDLIEEYVAKGTLLDIGCGTGHFLEIARERGWNCTGIEFNSKELVMAKDKGLNVLNVNINDKYFDSKRYDTITLWEVLEHVADPIGMLKRANTLLNTKGCLFILVPNRDSLINRMLHEKSNTLTGHCHINFFNARILKKLYEENGFRILETETIMSELSNVNNYLCYEDAYHGECSETISFLTPSFIHENLLGCKLLMLGQKIDNI